MAKKKKENRGGAGRGQGRKKELPYESKNLKVPEPLIPSFKKQIDEYKAKVKEV